MSTAYRARMRLTSDRIFFGSMALAMILIVFAGFAPTYYLMRYTDAPELAPLVHLHGIVLSIWYFFFLGQTALVSAGRTDIHRIMGVVGIALVFAILVLGTSLAIGGGRAGVDRPFMSGRSFMLLPLSIMVLFALFVSLGFWQRRDPPAHKRLMLLASITMLVPAIARLQLPTGLPGPASALIATDFIVLVAWVYDWRSRGAVHPVLLWGGLLYIISGPLRWFGAQTEVWQSFAGWLLA